MCMQMWCSVEGSEEKTMTCSTPIAHLQITDRADPGVVLVVHQSCCMLAVVHLFW